MITEIFKYIANIQVMWRELSFDNYDDNWSAENMKTGREVKGGINRIRTERLNMNYKRQKKKSTAIVRRDRKMEL